MKLHGIEKEAPTTREWAKYGDAWETVLDLKEGEWAHFEADTLDDALSFTQSMRYRGKRESIPVSVKRKKLHVWICVI